MVDDGVTSGDDDLGEVVVERYARVTESHGSLAIDNKCEQGREV
jgi:hypothetical protein